MMAEKKTLINTAQDGYSLETFPQPLHEKFLCTICEKVLRDPVQSCCGHLFCRSCIESDIRFVTIYILDLVKIISCIACAMDPVNCCSRYWIKEISFSHAYPFTFPSTDRAQTWVGHVYFGLKWDVNVFKT